jgi:hypothetical protein
MNADTSCDGIWARKDVDYALPDIGVDDQEILFELFERVHFPVYEKGGIVYRTGWIVDIGVEPADQATVPVDRDKVDFAGMRIAFQVLHQMALRKKMGLQVGESLGHSENLNLVDLFVYRLLTRGVL